MSATETEQVTEDGSKGKIVRATCERCSRETFHNVLKSVEAFDQSQDMAHGASFEIIDCAGCGWISFRQSWWDSENLEQIDHPDGGVLDGNPIEIVLLFPARRKGIRWLEHEHYLPSTVRQLYREKTYALTNNLPVLAGIGIRALIEAVCAHYGATAPNLKARIDELVGKGKLSDDQRHSLHGCRCLGNEAAHEAKVASDEELEIANDITDLLLKSAFIHSRLHRRLPQDRPRKPKPQT